MHGNGSLVAVHCACMCGGTGRARGKGRRTEGDRERDLGWTVGRWEDSVPGTAVAAHRLPLASGLRPIDGFRPPGPRLVLSCSLPPPAVATLPNSTSLLYSALLCSALRVHSPANNTTHHWNPSKLWHTTLLAKHFLADLCITHDTPPSLVVFFPPPPRPAAAKRLRPRPRPLLPPPIPHRRIPPFVLPLNFTKQNSNHARSLRRRRLCARRLGPGPAPAHDPGRCECTAVGACSARPLR